MSDLPSTPELIQFTDLDCKEPHSGVLGTSLRDVLLTSALLQARQWSQVKEASESNTQNPELVNMWLLSPTHCH